ncbi:phage tail protein, partial [Escherichia coli]|nr:phage tail protein [Escherichia coli]
MTNRLSTEILINLAGNLTAKARQYGANMSEFASRNQKAMSVVKAASESAGRGLDMLSNRYTTMIAGLASGAALREFAKTDRQLTGLGIAAGKTRDEMRNIFDGIQD